jgi:hypothetical protein
MKLASIDPVDVLITVVPTLILFSRLLPFLRRFKDSGTQSAGFPEKALG